MQATPPPNSGDSPPPINSTAYAQAMADSRDSASPNSSNQQRKPSQQGSGAPKSLLSCELCRHRKIKCDKADGGCSNCKRSGSKCVYLNRQRLPRGRNGGRKRVDTELKARVGRLENLVKTLEAGNQGALEPNLNNPDELAPVWPSPNESHTSIQRNMQNKSTLDDDAKADRYMGSRFWSSLSHEVSSLRHILDEESDEDDETDVSGLNREADKSTSLEPAYSFVFCGPNSLVVSPEVAQHPPKFMVNGLCEVFLHSVDPAFKVLHGPSLRAFMQNGMPYLDYPPEHPAVEALSFAVYYAAIATQTPETCLHQFGEQKSVLFSRYRFQLEAALSRADFINTRDITVLQAFLLLVICARTQDNSRFTWTMLSLAVRIAHALNLHDDIAYSDSMPAFQRETRRRVWCSILTLDLQASFDRSSDPLVHPNSFSTPMPLNLDDTDLVFGSTAQPVERRGITDTSVCILTAIASLTGKTLNYVPRGANGRPPLEIEESWERRRQIAIDFKRAIDEKFVQYADERIPRDWNIKHVSEICAANMLLGAVRPLQRHPKCNPPKISGLMVLELATAVLEKSVVMQAAETYRRSNYQWFGSLYNQWHAVAVVAAELCVHTSGPVVDRAWAVIDPAMSRFSSTVADSQKGMLWRPIEKLVKKARELRATVQTKRPSQSPDTTMVNPLDPPSSRFSSMNMNPATAAAMAPQTTDPAAAQFALGTSMPDPGMGMPLLYQTTPPSNFDLGAFDANVDWRQWTWPTESFDHSGSASQTDSPAQAWASWENFVEGLHDKQDSLFGMQMDPQDPMSGMGQGF